MNAMPMFSDAKRLLAIAESDLASAGALFASLDVKIRQEEICLHCHAAIEKALKACSFANGYEPPYTHSLTQLVEHVRKTVGPQGLPSDFDAMPYAYLDAYSSIARYTSLLPHADRTVAKKALDDARGAFHAIESFLLSKDAKHGVVE